MGFYARYILPSLIDCACGMKPMQALRAQVAPLAEGVVLELGFGSGHNLSFYDPARVSKIFALEPDAGMLKLARKKAARSVLPIEILPEKAEDLSLPPASVDSVLVTFSLCTIPDPVAALVGARRALKPGGKLLFCEHGLAPDPEVRRTQAKVEPFLRRINGGCHLTRNIPNLIRQGGFALDAYEAGYMSKGPRFVSYCYHGTALAAS